MADGLLTSILGAIDRQKQATKAGLGLLVSDPMEFARNATARYFPTPEEVAQQRAIEQAGGDTFNTPYMEKMFNLAQFKGNIKGIAKTQFDIANEIAQKNATEMLGLPPNNTAADRAKALGFDKEGFHATGADFRKIDPEMIAKSDYGTIGQGFYIDPSKGAGYSNLVARINQAKAPQNIMPVKFKSGNLYDMTGTIGPTSAEGSKRLTANMKDAGFSGTFTNLPDGSINEVAIFDPSIVRSRFAAFDPARVNEPDLLAAGVPLGLLAGTDIEMPKKKQKKPKK
jgi:hypothetical protein